MRGGTTRVKTQGIRKRDRHREDTVHAHAQLPKPYTTDYEHLSIYNIYTFVCTSICKLRTRSLRKLVASANTQGIPTSLLRSLGNWGALTERGANDNTSPQVEKPIAHTLRHNVFTKHPLVLPRRQTDPDVNIAKHPLVLPRRQTDPDVYMFKAPAICALALHGSELHLFKVVKVIS